MIIGFGIDPIIETLGSQAFAVGFCFLPGGKIAQSNAIICSGQIRCGIFNFRHIGGMFCGFQFGGKTFRLRFDFENGNLNNIFPGSCGGHRSGL